MQEQDILDQLESSTLEMGFGSRDRDFDRSRDSDRGSDNIMTANDFASADSDKVYSLDHDIFGNTNIDFNH